MLRLIEDDSLFQIAVKRLDGLFSPDQIYVVTVKDQAEILQEQCPGIPAENFILEPLPRGTASVVGLAATALKHRDPQATMAILTADHYIGNIDKFHRLLLAAYEVAQQGHLVTLGITPTFPATGYGYIQSGAQLGTYQELQVYHAQRFQEKPSEEQARKMLEGGEHSWNSGMFVWQADTVLKEFKRQMPQLAAHLDTLARFWGSPQEQPVLQQVWPQIQEQSIDYGIMEHATDVVVIPAAGLGWNDVGSWDALFDVLPLDANGNIVMGGKHIGLDTTSSLVYVNQEHRLIVTLGIDELIVVDTGDVLLICRKDQAQKVRQVVNQLKQTDQNYI
jgi:mannose-1-phosphate guanylyltransferase